MIRTSNLTASISREAGGLFEGVRRLVQSLQETGVDGRVYGLQDQFTGADLEAWQPVTASAFRPAWPGSLGYSPRYLEELLAYEPELVHSHGIWMYSSVATTTFSRNRRCPYVISVHGMLDPWAVQNSRWKKKVAWLLYEGAHLRGARCLRALCEEEAGSFRKLGLKNDIAVIPNGVDLPKGLPASPPPWEGMIEPGRKVLLFLSRIHPKKGLANLLRAWGEAQKTGAGTPHANDWVLAIAGWDQAGHEGELKKLATDLNVRWRDIREQKPGTVSADSDDGGGASALFLGPQFGPAKEACFAGCDAFILPSVSEGVPLVVLEAWGNSRPVLMTPQCNLPAGFDKGAAVKMEPTTGGIAGALRELFQTPEPERLAMGGRGHALVRERFVWSQVAEEMKRLYEWMLGGGAKPACMADN